MLTVIAPEGIWMTLLLAVAYAMKINYQNGALCKTLNTTEMTDLIIVDKEILIQNIPSIEKIFVERDFDIEKPNVSRQFSFDLEEEIAQNFACNMGYS